MSGSRLRIQAAKSVRQGERELMGKQRIVIIDDDVCYMEMIKLVLEGAGYEVCIASTSFEAQQYVYGDRRPSLIIIDVMMPIWSGSQTATMIRNNEHSKSIPILYLSGKSEELLQSLARESGVNGYLAKPATPQKIIETVSRLIQ